jgi:hypothetical protein
MDIHTEYDEIITRARAAVGNGSAARAMGDWKPPMVTVVAVCAAADWNDAFDALCDVRIFHDPDGVLDDIAVACTASAVAAWFMLNTPVQL